MAKLYSKEEIAAIYRKTNQGFGNEKLSDDEVLNKLSTMSGGDKWLSRIAPTPPTMKELATQAFNAAPPAGLSDALKFKNMQQPVAPTLPAGLSAAARAAVGAVGGQVKPLLTVPPYAGAGVVKGATMGYVDPANRLNQMGLDVPELTKKRAEAAGEFIGAVIPISGTSKVASLGLKAAGVNAAARPALLGLAQAGTSGTIYGAARKPATGETRGQNALNDAAVFMAFTGTGQIVNKAATYYLENYTNAGRLKAYGAARQQIIDVFVAKGAGPEEAKVMADAGLAKTIQNLEGQRAKAKDWRALGEAVKSGDRVITGEAPVNMSQRPEVGRLELPAPEGPFPWTEAIKADIAKGKAPAVAPATVEPIPEPMPGMFLPAEQQRTFMQEQVKVLSDVKQRMGLTSPQVADLVLDKARDGITLRDIVTRGIMQGKTATAMADEYHAFLTGIAKTVEAQGAPAIMPVDPGQQIAGVTTGGAPAAPAVKEPWQMSGEEFEAANPILGDIAGKKIENAGQRDAAARVLMADHVIDHNKFREITGQDYKEVIPLQNLNTGNAIPSIPLQNDKLAGQLSTIGQWNSIYNLPLFSHIWTIQKALAAGQKVPFNVLQEYVGRTDGSGRDNQQEWAADAIRKLYPGKEFKPPITETNINAIPMGETGKYIWNMGGEQLQEKIAAEGYKMPEGKTNEQIRSDMAKYPNGDAWRKWAAEQEIRDRGVNHRLPDFIVKKFGLKKDIAAVKEAEATSKEMEVAAKADTAKAFLESRPGGATPFKTAVVKLGYFNKEKVLKWLQVENGQEWKGKELPEEFAPYIRKGGLVGPGDVTEYMYFNGSIPENDPNLVISGLALDIKITKALKTGEDIGGILPTRDMTQYGSAYMAKRRAPIDLPGQMFIPGTEPAKLSLPEGKIEKETGITQEQFDDNFTPDNTISLFEAINEAAEAGKELKAELEKPIKNTPSGQASTAAPVLDKVQANFQPITQDKDFKLWRATEMIIEKYAKRYGEDNYRPRGAVGVFYPATKSIFLQAANNVYVAIHEVVHFIDDKTDWFKNLMVVVGTAENGNPIYDPSSKKIRKLLTQFYLETYPTAKANHPLKKRMKEGTAMLIEMACERPEMLTAPEWKPLADAILRPTGRFYNKDFADLEKEGLAVMDQYRKLSPNQQIGAHKVDKDRKRNNETLFTMWDKVQEVMFDAPHKFLKLDILTGQKNTPDSVYNAIQAAKYVGAITNSHFNPNRGLWVLLNRGFVKVGERNLGYLFREIKTLQNVDMFDNWLIARRVNAGYEKMEVIRQRILGITGAVYDLEKPDLAALQKWRIVKQLELSPEDYAATLSAIKSNAREYRDLAKLAANDNIGKDLAKRAHEDDKENFKKLAEIHDEITATVIDMIEDVGMISHAKAAELKANKAYASFRRDILSLIQNEGKPIRHGTGTAASFLKKRVGSELAYEGPLGGLIKNILEASRKTMIQRVINRIYNMTKNNPELLATTFDISPKLKLKPNGRGGFDLPQLADKNIIMARENGKYKPILVLDQSLMDILKLTMLDPKTAEVLEKAVRFMAVTFTRGTTATYLPFSITNIPRDTVTGFIQSDTKLIPFRDHLKTIRAMARQDGSPLALAVDQYLILTGGRLTLAHMYDGDPTPDEVYRRLLRVETKMEKALRYADNFGEIITTPSKVGEDLNRGVEFANSIEQGDDVLTAAEKAAQVTDPFTHRGTLGGQMGRTLVRAGSFINPSLQVLHQFIKTGADPKKRTRMAIAMLAYTAMTLGGTYAIRTASKRQKQNYKGRQIGQNSGVIPFPLPGKTARDKGRLGKIAVSSNYAVPANLINMMVREYMLEDDKYAGDEYMQAATAWIPDQFNLAQANRVFFSWAPALILPAFTVLTGVKTFPKAMPLTPKLLQNLPTKEQYNDNTSGAAKAISNVLPKALDLNPIEVDYLIEGYLGRTSRFITGRTGMGIFTNPLYNDLYLGASRDLEFYYKVRDAINEQQNSFRQQVLDAGAAQGAALDIDPEADVKSVVDAAKDANITFLEPSKEFLRMIEFKEYTVPIEKKMSRFRFLSRVKTPGPATTAERDDMRDQILDDIDLLHQAYKK